jgi:hypothetical protein
VEHSEGEDGESVVAILKFLCGSPACVSKGPRRWYP